MTQEEKAKAYDEAIERAKGAHNSAKSDKENGVTDKITEYTIQLTETIFPELAESEDERIKKVVKDFIENFLFWEKNNLTKEKALAWLEKQGEQKQEWSEWDRILQDSSISYLCNLRETFETKGWDKEQIQKCINWLHSLRPQNTWKPSDKHN